MIWSVLAEIDLVGVAGFRFSGGIRQQVPTRHSPLKVQTFGAAFEPDGSTVIRRTGLRHDLVQY